VTGIDVDAEGAVDEVGDDDVAGAASGGRLELHAATSPIRRAAAPRARRRGFRSR
jgi:hypothetical protein